METTLLRIESISRQKPVLTCDGFWILADSIDANARYIPQASVIRRAICRISVNDAFRFAPVAGLVRYRCWLTVNSRVNRPQSPGGRSFGPAGTVRTGDTKVRSEQFFRTNGGFPATASRPAARGGAAGMPWLVIVCAAGPAGLILVR
jgi:hypothetical protein